MATYVKVDWYQKEGPVWSRQLDHTSGYSALPVDRLVTQHARRSVPTINDSKKREEQAYENHCL
jgi:hypothetical protein